MPVLVVEDEADVRESMEVLLEDEGLPTVFATNGSEALDLLRRPDFQACVIVLDLMMPVTDGWEFLEKRARDPKLRAIPVIIVSAYVGKDADNALLGESDVFLPKPLFVGDLMSVIEKHCHHRRA
jgi:CheY-like chemotaxis protein